MTEKSSNRPNTADPFQNPILTALRGRDQALKLWEGPGSESEKYLILHGSWNDIGSTEAGAQKLLKALWECFAKEGIIAQSLEIHGKERMPEFEMDFEFAPSEHAKVDKVLRKIIAASIALEEAKSQLPLRGFE